MLDAGNYDYVTIAPPIDAAGRAIRQVLPAARQLNAAVTKAIHLDGGMMATEVRVDQCDIEELTIASTLAVEQGRDDSQCGVHTSTYIA